MISDLEIDLSFWDFSSRCSNVHCFVPHLFRQFKPLIVSDYAAD